jgi:hypothetical protein
VNLIGPYTLLLGWVPELGLAELEVRAITDRGVIGYGVVLALVGPTGERVAVRVYDHTHGFNEEHHCDRQGTRGPGERFHEGTASEGFLVAQRLIRQGYVTMIEAWARQAT